jgi:tetratricopeptide (TPR) repeat protein
MLALLTGLPSICVAQDQEDGQALDPTMLIDELAQQGMGELLLHLVETEKPSDPATAKQVEIAGLRIDYQRLLAEAGRTASRDPREAEALRKQAEQAFAKLTDATRALIRDFYDNDQRPIWQTDLAQSLIIDQLYGLNNAAPLFAEFGVTTPEQREALATVGPEVLSLLSDAQLRLFNLRGEIGRDPARSQKLQTSGLFFRLFDEYDQRRTPYYLAYAANLVAHLPDGVPYYTDPDAAKTLRIPHYEPDPQRERARLLELAELELDKAESKLGNGLGVRDAAIALRGRVLLARDRADQAINAVDELLSGEQRGLTWLTAKLTRAAALNVKGLPEQALQELRDLSSDPAVADDLRFSLLVTDLTHGVMLSEAEKLPPNRRDEAVAASYQPYLALLSGPYTGTQMQGLRDFIYKRWESTLGDTQGVDTLPPLVRLAVSQVLRQQGQAINAQIDGQDAQDLSSNARLNLLKQAQDKFADAIRIAQTLTGPDVKPEIRSEAMYNQAIAMHSKAPSDPANRLKVTTILTDLADQMPGQPVAEDAITAAVALLRELHQVLPTPPGVEQAYERAVSVLFNKFPTSEAADNERLYYGYTVFAQNGKHREAVDMFQRVPFDHDDYFAAQRQSLISLHELDKQAQPAAKPRIRREIDSLTKRITTEAADIQGSSINPDRADAARRAEATTKLITAELAMDDRDFAAVISALDGFEQAYPDQADLIAEALQNRIIALGDAGKHEELAAAAQRMVTDYPEQAAPVIDQVLTQAEQRIESLQVELATATSQTRQALQTQIDAQARAAAVLSGYLLEWANAQDFDAQTLMPFEVIRAKTLRLSGDTDKAYPILAKLVNEYPNDAQVMLEYAQVLYARGDEDSLVEAVRFCDRLITGLGAPYPKEWWIAWMRRLQINDQLNEGTAEIPLRVRQLRMTDPDLGGPVTKLELERLEHKHSR